MDLNWHKFVSRLIQIYFILVKLGKIKDSADCGFVVVVVGMEKRQDK